MIGIYKITNKFTGESYIGQSKDIDQRYKEHLYHNQSDIDKAIHEMGPENFTFEVLEECNVNDLDRLEDFYILKYDSINHGYNNVRGGQHNVGESNSNSKLTETEVYDIRESYRKRELKRETYERYKHKITWYTFSNLWEGQFWKNVHMDVYTDGNKKYYARGADATRRFTFEEVMRYRTRYIHESALEIYESTDKRVSLDAFQKMLWGHSYKDIPVYVKSEDRWDTTEYLNS